MARRSPKKTVKKKIQKQLPFPTNKVKKVAKEKPVLLIATPIAYRAEPSDGYKESINALFEMEDDLPFKIDHQILPATNIGLGRNALINGGKNTAKYQGETVDKMPYDGILFIDSDMNFLPKDVLDLLDKDLPIIGAKYQNRAVADLANAGWWSQAIGFSPHNNWLRMEAKGLNKVDWTGSGFLFISKNTLKAMPYPWFYDMLVEVNAPDGTPISAVTTDEFGFAASAFRYGHNIFIDADISIIHEHGMKEVSDG